MRALTWHGKRDVRIDTVPDPAIEEPTDAVIRITTSGLCGSDLHLYEVLGAFMDAGDVLGHEPMGIVEEVGSGVSELRPGDRVVIPFQISCGSCFMCDLQLYTQCETTQVREQGKGAALFGYTKLYGQVPGGQAEYLRVPHAEAELDRDRGVVVLARRDHLVAREARVPRAPGDEVRPRARAADLLRRREHLPEDRLRLLRRERHHALRALVLRMFTSINRIKVNGSFSLRTCLSAERLST